MIMKSPFTGGKAVLCYENREAIFRKEHFCYVHRYYKCSDTGEIFTTTKIDCVNLMQIHNQYRIKYGIPFPDEIKATRNHYGFSASKMSRILGFGENTYRLYENGDMPNIANGRTLMAIQSPSVFIRFLEDAKGELSVEEYNKAISRISDEDRIQKFLERLVFGGKPRGIFNGYTYQSISKLKNAILYFIEKMNGVFVTKMNKLLFFADFVSYRENGQAITGLSYKAIQFGPVPEHWDSIYGLIEDIDQIIVDFGNGNSGQKLVSKISFDASVFTPEQMSVLEHVCTTFYNDTSSEISNRSHNEDAWIENVDCHDIISFDYAFSLKEI